MRYPESMTELAYAEEESPLKKIAGMLLTAVIVVSIIGGAFYLFRLTHPKSELSDHPQTERITKALNDPKTASYYKDLIPANTGSKDNVAGVQSTPSFNVGRYTIATTLPFLPAQTKIYTFKNSFPEEQTFALAKKLLTDNVRLVTTKDGVRTYSSDFGYLLFNTSTGTFELNSVGTQAPFEHLKTIADIRPALTTYLQDTLHVIDDTATLTAYYQRNTAPDVTYYEFHRDADKVGLQIISPVGVANLPEDMPLKKVTINTFAVDSANDATIILASDTPGKARRNDFNTLTVGVNSAGAITSIESNLRPIESFEYVSGLALGVLSPDQALDELQKQGSYFNISVPSGQGTIEYDKVYVNNQLKTKEAVITDMALSFIEKPAHVAQRYLQPVYIVRGYAETDTGVRVRFVQTVPAVENLESTAQLPFIKSAFALETRIPCPNGTGTCTFETFRNTPTPLPPGATATPVQPTLTNTPQATVTPPTTTTNRCVLYNNVGDLIEEGRPIFVNGIGTVYYFSNLPSGPLVVPNAYQDLYTSPQEGDPSLASITFEERIQNELITIGARIMRDEPSRIVYGNNGIDIKRLYNTATDIQNMRAADYGNGVGEQAIYWDTIANSLAEHRSNLDAILHNPTPLSDAGLSNETIWLARRNSHQLGINSRTYGNVQLDSRCRFITTISPLIYFYPLTSMNIGLTFSHDKVSYVDPYLSKKVSFTAEPSGTLHFGNNVTRGRLHYEYTDTTFARPQQGWIVSAENVGIKVADVAQKLALNQQETQDLMKEVERAKLDLQGTQTVFVGLINEATIAQKLPFTLSPQPTTLRRIHFYFEPVSAQLSPIAPAISPIIRTGFTVIELGTYVTE